MRNMVSQILGRGLHNWEERTVRGFLLAGLAVAISMTAGCVRSPQVQETRASSASSIEPTSAVPLDSAGRGKLTGVSVVQSDGYGTGPGTPEARAYDRFDGHRVDVGIFGSIRGVETKLVVPMWYGEHTTYTLEREGETTSLVEAAKLRGGFRAVADPGSVVWWSGPGCAVTYHFEDGCFVLDSLVSKVPH
jgi:hypothetical protein